MSVQDDLLELERQFWTGDAEFYRKNLDERCLTAFAEMAGVFSKEEIANTIEEGSRWKDVDIAVKGFLEPADDFALLSYEATAMRAAGGERYSALVSSGYVRRARAWKMAFHTQTPLPST